MNKFYKNKYIPRVVVLYHGGEPLLNKNLVYFISELKKLQINKIKLNTNGSLLTEKISDSLVNLLHEEDNIEISFDGESPDENDQIRRNGCFLRDSENVMYFLNHPKRRCKITIANTQILTKSRIESLSKNSKQLAVPQYLREKFQDKIHSYLSYPAMPWPGMHHSFGIQKNKSDTSGAEKNIKICTIPFETFTILSNGDVVPCCYDILGMEVLGNINNTSPFSIWSNDIFKKFKNNLITGQWQSNKICSECARQKQEYLVKD